MEQNKNTRWSREKYRDYILVRSANVWKTMLKQSNRPDGRSDVILSSGDGSIAAVISLDEWWIMSANQDLANQALQAADLNFKAHEVRPLSRVQNPAWTTGIVQEADKEHVNLFRDGSIIASMPLNDWASLSATRLVIDNVIEAAESLAQYGDNIDEVEEYARHEEREMDGESEDEYDEDEDHDEP
jgi:hypothetical protein